MKPHLLLLGSTGRTGKWLLEEALERGYHVTVLVRNASKIAPHPLLTVLEGNPYNAADIQQAAIGCGAVLSALNISRHSDFPWAKLRTPADFLSQTMQNILQTGIKRVIFTSAWGVAETKPDIPGWFRWLIDHSNIGVAYRDHERQEALLDQSEAQYTSVRPVGLTNSTKTEKIQVTLAQNLPKPSLTISRRSVAKFMLDCLENKSYIRQKPIVSA